MNTLLLLLTLSAVAPDAALKAEPTVHHELLSEKRAVKTRKTKSTAAQRRRKSIKARKAKARENRLQHLLALDVEPTATAQPSKIQTQIKPNETKQGTALITNPLADVSGNAPDAQKHASGPKSRALPLAVLENAEIGKALIPLFILAAFALFFTLVKKRRHGLEAVRVLESTTIGKGRQILVVEVAGQRLLLGSSEAGISVLKERIEIPRATQTQAQGLEHEAAAFSANPLFDAVRRALGMGAEKPTPVTASFESHLTCETSACSEDEELRRKLTARLAAVS